MDICDLMSSNKTKLNVSINKLVVLDNKVEVTLSMTLGGVDESQKCISTGPYERFYGLKRLCKRIFLKNHCCGR